MTDQSKIRNFSIIAHIDHGKSTLSDRMIEICGAVAQRQMESEQWDGGYSVTRRRKAEKKPAPGKAPGKGSPSPQRDLSFLPPGAKNLLERLEKGSAHVEELTQLAGEAGGEALALLTELEILGLVKSLPGGYYSLC